MSPAWQVALYAVAIACFLAAAWGFTGGARRPIALGWLGVALVTLVLLVGAVDAI